MQALIAPRVSRPLPGVPAPLAGIASVVQLAKFERSRQVWVGEANGIAHLYLARPSVEQTSEGFAPVLRITQHGQRPRYIRGAALATLPQARAAACLLEFDVHCCVEA